jgi:hypothetical protein
MQALKYGAFIAVVAGLITGMLLAAADPAYPAPRAQSYCLDERAADAEPGRWPGLQGCRPEPFDQWLGPGEHLIPASQDVRFN